jgi:hypothetical protein
VGLRRHAGSRPRLRRVGPATGRGARGQVTSESGCSTSCP